ncbi:MAG: hypothetical protein P8179_09920 [Candidatus Thiodiazotropha sp.]
MSASGLVKWQTKLAVIPLPALSVLVGVLCGFVMWLVLEPIQDRRLEKVFHDELVKRLDVRAVETRLRFEQYLNEWQSAGHALSHHWLIKNHISSPEWLKQGPTVQLKRYQNRLPVWFEK